MKTNRLSLIVIALVMIALGIYVIFGTDGNDPSSIASNEYACSQAVEQAKSLDQSIGGDVAAFRTIDKAIDVSALSFVNSENKQTALADWKGRTVLFNLWATWCAPCREEMPALEALEAELGNEVFQVVPVSIDLDSADKPKGFYQQNGLKALPFFHDSTMEVFNILKKQGVAFGMPTTLIVGKDSCVMGVLNGPAHWASEDAKKLIKAALKL